VADLVFELGDTVYAIEIKATRNPGPRTFQNLKRFVQNTTRPVKAFLFYLGDSYETVEGIRLIPVGAIYRGASL
jgi:hypothetical protein